MCIRDSSLCNTRYSHTVGGCTDILRPAIRLRHARYLHSMVLVLAWGMVVLLADALATRYPVLTSRMLRQRLG
eukprot:3938964-Rhodomonas_salina.2